MSEDFSRHVARVAASQIAEATGFDACQDSAIEILGDLLLRYLSTVCSSSHSYAELAGRSQSNLSDVLLALDDLGVSPEELYQHMQLQATDVPFAHTLAQYPVHRQQPLPPSFADRKEQAAPHIPPFLPAFPDPHTYQQTPAYAGHQTDPHKQRLSMLEAKQKSAAALHKLHQRISSKTNQPDANPFVEPPAVEQLQLSSLPAAAAAAAAAAATAASGRQQPGAADASGPSDVAAASAANGALHKEAKPAEAAAAGADGALEAGGPSSSSQQQQLGLLLPLLQRQQQLAAATAAGGGEDLEDEDVLFESAAVLKAFSSVLPPELIAQHAERLQGVSAEEQEARQRNRQRQKRGGGGAGGAAANGVNEEGDDFLIEEDEGVAAMDVDAGAAAAGDGQDPQQQWLLWEGQQQQQQQGQPGEQQQQRPAELLGPAGAAGPELLRFGIDPLAAAKSVAVRLAGRARPADAFAERSGGKPGGAAAVAGGLSGSSSRRRGKSDADAAREQATRILHASPESIFATTADGRQVQVFGGSLDDL